MNLSPARRQILRFLALVLLIILLLLLVVDFDALAEAIRATDWSEFALALLFLLAAYAIYVMRTRYMLRNKLGYRDALAVDSGGFMFSVLLQIPRDAFRALAMNRLPEVDGSTTASALTVGAITSMLVRLLGLMFAIIYGAASFRDADNPILPSILTVVVLLTLLFLLAKNSQRVRPYLARGLTRLPRVTPERGEQMTNSITRTLEEIASFRRFGVSLFLRILFWFFSLMFYFYTFEAMNIEITKPHLLIPLSIMVVAPPTSPMMIGIFHGAVIAILGTLKLLDADLAAAYAVNLHLVQMIIFIILGVIGLRRLNLKFSTIFKEIRSRTSKES